ncbi:hypothetical protein EVAR_88471_1 [Eumeta japonica]|uniref:Uncharacterized protein n=1 Tax=Eumeta variegata TaxID=151549 RepID=A0A4C1XR68_EUMVA|nr:hypothetical protein EVAR_88471_1 [Eumeta japonica]
MHSAPGSPPPKDTRNDGRAISALPTFLVEIEYLKKGVLMEEWGDGRVYGPPEISPTGRNTTAEAATSHSYSVRVWYFIDETVYFYDAAELATVWVYYISRIMGAGPSEPQHLFHSEHLIPLTPSCRHERYRNSGAVSRSTVFFGAGVWHNHHV